jgi:RNA polymerase sigma factor (sigma-70 family)
MINCPVTTCPLTQGPGLTPLRLGRKTPGARRTGGRLDATRPPGRPGDPSSDVKGLPPEGSQELPGEAGDLESTRTLIYRAREGDALALDRLFARFLPALRRWAHGRLPERARSLVETEDLVQISLMRALARIDAFDPQRQGAFLAYLHQILINCVREEIRRASRRPGVDPLPDNVPEDRPTVLEKAIGREALGAYEAALLKLSEEQQQAVILRIEFGFTHQEIASTLGRPSADAVRMQVSRGLVRLAELMDEHH